MAKKPRPTKGVPEPVFQKELFNYLKRREAAPPGKKVSASFTYNGTKFTFERGNGPYNSGYQIKTSAGQVAKNTARSLRDQNIKLTEGEKMFMREYYAAAAERNVTEGRTGNRKLEVDHREPRSKGGPNHPYNMGLMERGDNIKKSNKQGGFGKYQSLLSPEGFKEWADHHSKRIKAAPKGLSLPARLNGVIGYVPELIEIADNYTNGAVSNGINTAGDAIANDVEYVAKDFASKVENGWNGLVDIVNGSKGDYGHNYGQ